ncbi:MAG: methionine biosynthesis protein MetW [Ignavibacteriaceae bacterium]
MPENKIDNPTMNDNRNYDYTQFPTGERHEYEVIAALIPLGAKVIDLGCGNGSLMELLILEKKVDIMGLEISESGVQTCLSKGLNVKKNRIDELMPFDDNEFDFSICNVTMQMVMSPEILLKEMKRISKYQIISFPNFAFYKNRLDLLIYGRMPRPMLFGYEWYNTGHIHQLSISDFETLVNETGELKIIERKFLKLNNRIKNFLIYSFPNLFQQISIFLLAKENVK